MGQIRVVVVDDHQLMLDAIRLTLEQSDDIELVGEALTGSEALPLIGRTQPDLVLARYPDASDGRSDVPRQDP